MSRFIPADRRALVGALHHFGPVQRLNDVGMTFGQIDEHLGGPLVKAAGGHTLRRDLLGRPTVEAQVAEVVPRNQVA